MLKIRELVGYFENMKLTIITAFHSPPYRNLVKLGLELPVVTHSVLAFNDVSHSSLDFSCKSIFAD